MKDPIGGNLDRIQVIKGWLDAKGDVQEKVYDVAWSGDRKPDANGKLPSVGTTVDVENATWTNTIGASELIAVWKDPDFDAKLRAFYYVRVIEIPTPRWTAYDAKKFGVKPLPGTHDDHHRARLHFAHLVQPGEVKPTPEPIHANQTNLPRADHCQPRAAVLRRKSESPPTSAPSTRRRWRKRPPSRLTRLTRGATTRPGRSSATRICTRPIRWTAARLARGSGRWRPTGSPRARKSWLPAASGRSSRGPSISWSSPITRTVSASSRCSFPAIPRRCPTRRPASGTT